MSPLVEIGLTDLPKTGEAKAPPAPPLATALHKYMRLAKFLVRVLDLNIAFEKHRCFKKLIVYKVITKLSTNILEINIRGDLSYIRKDMTF